jgi:hypothetical protein
MGKDFRGYGRKIWDAPPRVFPGTPPAPLHAVLRSQAVIKAENKPDPLAIMNGGLREGDRLLLSWVKSTSSNTEKISGCQLSAFRGREYLKWAIGFGGQGFGRDLSGKFIVMPYISQTSQTHDFATMVAESCGYNLECEMDAEAKKQFRLKASTEIRRLFIGDHLFFDVVAKKVVVKRLQSTVDMNLYRLKPEEQGILLSSPASYIVAPHHFPAIVGILAEANGRRVNRIGLDEFDVI